MYKLLFILSAMIILQACTGSGKQYNLLPVSGWSGNTPITETAEGLRLEGEMNTWTYRTGLFGSFRNFEMVAEIKTDSGANAAIQFHTRQNNPDSGYEVRIDNSPVGNWDQLLKTGSLSSIRNIHYNMVSNNDWFELRIRVVENSINISVNGHPVVNYIEPGIPFRPDQLSERTLGSGTFALKTLYQHTGMQIRKLRVNTLPEGEILQNRDPEYTRRMTELHIRKIPVADYHVHIKGDLTMDQAIRKSASLGINYGIAANCGLKFPIQTDEELRAYLESIDGLPIFKAMQAEGREWVNMFSPELVAGFDYAFTDAMTWTNNNGKRMRLWIPAETEIGDPEDFMEQLVKQIEKVLEEPISIYVNPTYLPAEIADRYEELWTEERIDRVVNALKKNNVALEINSKSQLPGKRFIQKAKAAGVKFAMGTNNGNAKNLGQLEWALEMIEEFQLQPSDMFLPETRF